MASEDKFNSSHYSSLYRHLEALKATLEAQEQACLDRLEISTGPESAKRLNEVRQDIQRIAEFPTNPVAPARPSWITPATYRAMRVFVLDAEELKKMPVFPVRGSERWATFESKFDALIAALDPNSVYLKAKKDGALKTVADYVKLSKSIRKSMRLDLKILSLNPDYESDLRDGFFNDMYALLPSSDGEGEAEDEDEDEDKSEAEHEDGSRTDGKGQEMGDQTWHDLAKKTDEELAEA